MSGVLRAAEAAVQPDALQRVTQVINLAVTVLAVVVLARRWRQRRSAATGWALAMFGVLAAIIVLGFFPVVDDGSLLRHGYTVALISVLLLVPLLLVLFARSLGALGTKSLRVSTALTAIVLLATLFAPRFPQPGEVRSGWFNAYLIVFLVTWTVQSFLAAGGLWSAGRGQPSVVRHRMRALSAGAVVLALALIGSGGSNDPESTTATVTTLAGVLGVILLVLAFVVPEWLRSAWRAADLIDLSAAERNLMAAMTPAAVAAAIVPALIRLFGASGAALSDMSGTAIESRGLSAQQVRDLRAELAASSSVDPVVVTPAGVFGCRLSGGWLIVRAGGFAPVFGAAELALLDRVGSFVDLALQRCQLFEQEAGSRAAAEAANAELQTLVYSVSHDLRNPIISVLGYLDVLAQEHAGQLHGQGAHYLERITVNAMYMQNLIQDLLELSRIGRSEPPPQEVELGALAESVAQEVRAVHAGCDITVAGEFPVVWMSELRARQLLTNLIDNAAKHGQGASTVSVAARPDEHGGAALFVSDSGPGIPPHLRDKAFEVFERLDAAHTDVPGTGMGLPICKRIVESLGGTITLDGPPPGTVTGTTVRIVLPIAAVRSWAAPHVLPLVTAKEPVR